MRSNRILQQTTFGIMTLSMRTTVALEPETERLLREAMRPRGQSFIAALAIAHRAEVHTADRDFRRFPGSSCRLPLER